MPPTAAPWSRWPALLAEDLRPLAEPLGALLQPGPAAPPALVARLAARALLDLPADPAPLPPWLAPHQRPAVRRLRAIVTRYGGALLADDVGLGKSYVALAVARVLDRPVALIVPAILAAQWDSLLARLGATARVVTHERLSAAQSDGGAVGDARLLVVDEAHRFRNPATRRYRALARLAVGRAVLLVTATPVHNRLADLVHLLHLFIRDDALTAFGVASLRVAARGDVDPDCLRAAVARLVVARSRQRARERATGPLLVFPDRARGTLVHAATAPDDTVRALAAAIGGLALDTRAAALVRLLLLSRLASSLPALRATTGRLAAYAAAARDAARHGRTLSPREFARWFPAGEGGDIQLALTPLLLDAGPSTGAIADPDALRDVVQRAASTVDPKAAALDRLLRDPQLKTIVFTNARATAHHLARLLGRRHRLAVITAGGGRWGTERGTRAAVLRAFAPDALGAAPPPHALTTDVLVATDLLSEGLNLQDAARVVHYDLPWTPARLAQRVGRIDRLGSRHACIATVAFLPPGPLAEAIALERRLAGKAAAQRRAGAAATEAPDGPAPGGVLDWCDRLQALAENGAPRRSDDPTASASGPAAVVLVVRLGGAAGLVEALVVDGAGCAADPDRATALLETAAGRAAREPDAAHAAVRAAVARAAATVRARLRTLTAARWRAVDRDAPGRRLVAWVLADARRAARAGDARRLARLDALVARLTQGMTAGEELLLRDLVEQRDPLEVRHLLDWHGRLPPPGDESRGPAAELVAAVVVGDACGGYLSA